MLIEGGLGRVRAFGTPNFLPDDVRGTGNQFHVDVKSGLVYTQPIRELQLPTSVGVTSEQEAERIAEKQFREVKKNLIESGRLGRYVLKAHRIASRLTQRDYLPTPGLISIGDDYYTGWYLVDDKGIIKSAHRKKVTESQVEENDIVIPIWGKTSSYFQLSLADAEYLQERITSGPISLAQAGLLAQSPHETSHPLYAQLLKLPIDEQIQTIRAETDEYMERSMALYRSGDTHTEAEYRRSNLLKLAIFNKVSKLFYKETISAVIKKMDESATTVFPLGEDVVVAGYQDRDHMVYRVLTMPQGKRNLFQRYGILGQSPMLKEEFIEQYKKLVDPHTEIFG